ncbi:MAG TPA: hypothetical protein VNJ54_08435 [Plantibacter sp.]|uniref:hypothetical protein n=1 Tax=unclassified Plantibacter TaxID=2624265 RepID=UPI002BAFE01B|nr:hypothetical protein [Plantibacter sp.]
MKRTLSAAALVLLAVVALPTAANAAGSETYGPGSCNSITPASVARGASVTYSCSDFWAAGERVSITIASESADASTRTLSTVANDAGDIEVSIDTESDPAGTYTLTATQGAVSDSSDFTVLDPADAAAAASASDPAAGGKALADTGFSGATLPWLAGGLVVVGAAALGTVVARRRQQA